MKRGAKVGIGASVAVILGIVLAGSAVGVWRMPSGSMIPTFQVSDRVLANRFRTSPARGDVIIFKSPEHPEQDFAKRVIAVGGDTLEVKNGHPILNGKEVPSCKVGTTTYQDPYGPGSAAAHKGDLYVEFLDGAAYLVFLDEAAHGTEYQGPFTAKPGEYWVLGDNRNNSHDSRMWFGGAGGGVPRDHIRATVMTDTKKPALPPSMQSLAAGLASCLAKRP